MQQMMVKDNNVNRLTKKQYSKNSNSGHSEIGTQDNTKDTGQGPIIVFPIHVALIHFEPPKEDNLSTKDKTTEFILIPRCPLFGGPTV